MVRSVKSVIEEYQRQGILDATAAYHVLGDTSYGKVPRVLTIVHEFVLDCCACVHCKLADIILTCGEWPDTKVHNSYISSMVMDTIERVQQEWSHRGYSVDIKTSFTKLDVEQYIRECLRILVMDRLREDTTFRKRVVALADKYYGKQKASVDVHIDGILSNLQPKKGDYTDDDIVNALRRFYGLQLTNSAIWRNQK